MRRSSSIHAADLFCGAGGTSAGLLLAAEELGLSVNLLAINHWPIAIETHSANHKAAVRLCESLDNVNPRKAIPSGRLHLLTASPECTHHSIARGGKPMNDQSRASAWHVLRWAEALRIDNILIENVKEFQGWGPLGANGRPMKSRVGETFHAFLNALRSLGYAVDFRVLNAADYGDPTTRERLFIMARRARKKIHWPEPTHSRDGDPTLFGKRDRWKAAREIIDWNIKGESIFTRKRPLAPATIERIIAGLRKFGGKNAEPFIVVLRNNQDARSLDKPLPTVTTSGAHFGLCEPFIVSAGGPEVSARSVSQPMNTVLTRDHMALVEPFIIHVTHSGSTNRSRSIDSPVPTVTTANGGELALVEPFVIGQQSGAVARAVDDPLPTVATKGAIALVEPFLMSYYGNGTAESVASPLPTVTTKDRFALVEPGQVDIRFRMLQPHELARAMSFPDDYRFAGNRSERVKQIGNAVPVGVAKALCRALLEAA